jgi:predicted transposase YdaD
MMMNQDELKYLIREFSDRSIQWLLETPDNIHGLLQVVSSDIAKQIDYSRIERVNRTFILDDFQKREADMIFTAPFIDDSGTFPKEVIIYILIESQSTVDQTMPFRLLFYMTHVWDMQRRWLEVNANTSHKWKFQPILPIVFYTGEQKWDYPSDMRQLVELPPSLERFVPRHETLFLNLKAIESEQLTKTGHPFGWLLRVMQKEKADKEEFKEALHLSTQYLEQMPPEEKANWLKLMHFLLAFINHRREKSERAELFDVVSDSVRENSKREEVKNMTETIAQALIREGKEEGLKEGLQQGMQEGKKEGKREGLLDAISLGLELKFGIDSLYLIEEISKIESIGKLMAIRDAIRMVDKLEQIEKLVI